MLNLRKVKARMVELGITQKDIANALNCKTPTVSQKLNGVRPLRLEELEALGKTLQLSDREYYPYFFNSENA